MNKDRQKMKKDPVCPERLDPDSVNIRPDPQPACSMVRRHRYVFMRIVQFFYE